ncbi:MAG: tetratricopeptide repeat protein [Alphaproteobacteria bacterium]|nr:tetratricopeptide repeat protein [Alphaproteobacteria bacterium]
MTTQTVSLEDAFQLGLNAHERGDIAHAKHIYDRILAVRSDFAGVLFYRGLIADAEGDIDAAIRFVERAASAEPQIADFQATLGSLALKKGSAPLALQRFQKALSLEANHPDAMTGLGLAYLALRRRDLAVDQLRKAVAAHPRQREALLALARALMSRGEPREATGWFQQVLEIDSTSAEAYLGLASALLAQDRLTEAGIAADAAAHVAPELPASHLILGQIARQKGDLDEALFCYLEALRLDPKSAEAHYNIANCHYDLESIDRAIEYYKKALELRPDNIDILTNLGIAVRRSGDLTSAEQYLSRALQLGRDNTEAMRSLGSLEEDRGDLDGARRRLVRAFELEHAEFLKDQLPAKGVKATSAAELAERLGRLRKIVRQGQDLYDFAGQLAQFNIEANHHDRVLDIYQKQSSLTARWLVALGLLAETLSSTGEIEEAEKCLKRAIEVRNQLAGCHYNAGIYAGNLKKTELAVTEFEQALKITPDDVLIGSALGAQYLNVGRAYDAEAIILKILEKEPDRAGDLNNLGLAYNAMHRLGDALEALRKAVKHNPSYAGGWSHLGGVYHTLGRISESKAAYLKALELEPDSPQAHNNLALVYQAITEYGKSIEHLRRSQELQPDNAAFHSNLLFGMQYDPEVTARDLYLETVRWGELHASKFYPTNKVYANVKDPERKLRIGYLSPDFRGHSCSYFVYPLYQNHDRSKVEVFSYAEVAAPDFWTEKFREASDGWRITCGVPDEELAKRIEADQIDILVDLSAHTGGARALVTAYKPAPIQVSWFGLGNTTGIKTIDYILSDPYFAPEGTERYYCEEVYRLPSTLYCYKSLHEFPEVGPLPALRNGYVTFASFSRTVRYNKRVIATWSRLLNSVPNSRLMLNTVSFSDEETRDMFHGFFEAHGVSRDRVSLIYTNPPTKTWATYNEVDIALDPFPHNAGLTTCEALWMGCPVLTLAERPPQGRYGASYLNNVGLPQFVATTEDEVVSIGHHWATHIDELAALRAGLRPQMASSRLSDAKTFAHDLETAFRDMWLRYCAD